MASFKDGLNSLFMMAEDHRRPNIIRGSSGFGKPFKSYPSLSQENATVSKPLNKDDTPIPLENLVFTSADALTTDSFVSALAVDSQNPIEKLEFDVGSTEFFESHAGESTCPDTVSIYGSDQPLQALGNKADQFPAEQSPVALGDGMDTQEPIIQASLETEEGNFIILMRGGEILSVLSKTPHEMDSDSSKVEQTTDLISETNECTIESIHLTVEEQNKGEISMQTSVSELEDSLKIGPLDSVTELNANNECYIMVQLPNGANALVPASALENSGLGDGQFFINTNQGILEETINDSKDKSSTAHSSTSKPTKQRKRTNTEAHPRGGSSPKKAHKQGRKGAGTTTTTSIQRQDFYNSNNFSKTQHSTGGTRKMPMKNGNSFPQPREPERKPTILEELGPARPFRFDFSDEDSMDGEPSSFVSLVVEAFQKDAENHSEDVKTVGKNLPTEMDPDSSSSCGPMDIPEPDTKKEKEVGHERFIMSLVQCSKCSYKATNRGYLNQHMSLCHSDDLPYSCTKCDGRFSYRFLLLDHCNKMHRLKDNNVVEKCKLCQQEFQSKEILSAHLKECTTSNVYEDFEENSTENTDAISIRNRSETSTSRRTVYSQSKKIPCPINTCSKWFSDSLALMRHRITVHISTGPFCCELCEDEAGYDSKEELLKHTYTHSDCSSRPYVCTVCKRYFKLENHLNDHIKTHVHRDNHPCQAEEAKEKIEPLKSPEQLVKVIDSSVRQITTAAEKPHDELFGKFPSQADLNNIESKTSSSNDLFTDQFGLSKDTNDDDDAMPTVFNLATSEGKDSANITSTDLHEGGISISSNAAAGGKAENSVIVNAELDPNVLAVVPGSKANKVAELAEVAQYLTPPSDIQENDIFTENEVENNSSSIKSKIDKQDTGITAQTDAAVSTSDGALVNQSKCKVNNYTDRSVIRSQNLGGVNNSNINFLSPSTRRDKQTRRKQNERKEAETSERPDRNEDDVRNDFHALYTKLSSGAHSDSKQQVTGKHKDKKSSVAEGLKNKVSSAFSGKAKSGSCSSEAKLEKNNDEVIQQATRTNDKKSKTHVSVSKETQKDNVKEASLTVLKKEIAGKEIVPTRPLKSQELDVRKCVLELNARVKLRKDSKKRSPTKLSKDTIRNTRKHTAKTKTVKTTNLNNQADSEPQVQQRKIHTRQQSSKKY